MSITYSIATNQQKSQQLQNDIEHFLNTGGKIDQLSTQPSKSKQIRPSKDNILEQLKFKKLSKAERLQYIYQDLQSGKDITSSDTAQKYGISKVLACEYLRALAHQYPTIHINRKHTAYRYSIPTATASLGMSSRNQYADLLPMDDLVTVLCHAEQKLKALQQQLQPRC